MTFKTKTSICRFLFKKNVDSYCIVCDLQFLIQKKNEQKFSDETYLLKKNYNVQDVI